MISCVITAFDKHDITKIHVREVMNSTIIPDEIIVVNDGGTPDLKDKLKQLEKKTKIIYAEVLPPKIPWNYNGACNLGVWLSKGDYLIFEDNDNIPHKDFYKSALEILESQPIVGRVIARKRLEFSVKDLEKPVEEWQITGTRGPNQGTYMMRRSVYLQLKGQDERFCGRYGWMYYDWRHRLLAVTQFSSVGCYYYVLEGQSDIPRGNSPLNASFMRDNMRNKRLQSPIGILNFNYTYEIL